MQKKLFLLLLLSNTYLYSQNLDFNDLDFDVENTEESSSFDFGELEEPEFHEPSKFELFMQKYGIKILQSYLDLKKWIHDKLD